MDLLAPPLVRERRRFCRSLKFLARNEIIDLREWRESLVVPDRTEILRPPRLEVMDLELVAREILFCATLSERTELELLADAMSAMRLVFGDDARG